MPADIYVTKMFCKSQGGVLNHIKFFYSDGSTSPLVETEKGEKIKDKDVTFDENTRPIRKIKAHGNDRFVADIHFFDKEGAKVAFYDPGERVG